MCQNWDLQTPHSHDRTPKNYPNSGLEENFCRNPDGDSFIWCYTTDKNTRSEYCDPIDISYPEQIIYSERPSTSSML